MRPGYVTALRICLLVLVMLPFLAQAQIKLPVSNDQYAFYVKQLESGKTDIDYTDFRMSFLNSKLYPLIRSVKFDSLRKEMYKAIERKDYPAVVAASQGMLSIDYTSMLAHKILQQTYKILNDTANNRKYHDIEFGLLKSVVGSGDGKACATAWEVIQIEEEYFILDMLDARLQEQSLDNSGGLCDRMDVITEEGSPKTYYFEVSKIFERRSELFKEKEY